MKVLIAGDFGKFHIGHLDHILKASKLGNYLLIITHTDESIRQRKGYEPDNLEKRVEILNKMLEAYRIKGEVKLSLDTDGTVIKTLEHYCPDIFAKGGDRSPDNMPPEEKETCRRLGIEIRYGIGDKLGESRQIAHKI